MVDEVDEELALLAANLAQAATKAAELKMQQNIAAKAPTAGTRSEKENTTKTQGNTRKRNKERSSKETRGKHKENERKT